MNCKSTTVTPPGYLASHDLASRGWSPSLIKKLLGKADAKQDASRGIYRIVRALYLTDRVEAIEKSPAFAEALADRAYRATATERRFVDFDRKYSDWRGALPEACAYLHSLNRYCKHDTCAPSHRDEIYSLKNQMVRLLYESGYSIAAFEHVLVLPPKMCNACGGRSNTPEWQECTRSDYDDGYCDRCNNTGEYLAAKRIPFVIFRFDIVGRIFTWHQPKRLVDWPITKTHPPAEWDGVERDKPLPISKAYFAEAKDLLRWVLARAGNAEPPNPVEWLADRPISAVDGNQEVLF